MKKEFCTYEQSLALKELGFEVTQVLYYYDNNLEITYCDGEYAYPNNDNVIAVLIQQAFRFFREKYGLNYFIEYDDNLYVGVIQNSSFVYRFNTYEEAEQACLDKLIELAKESKQ